jgi:homoserine dehydrogenase
LAEIARILSLYQISISSVYQQIREMGREVPIVVLTHEATEHKVQKAIARINRLKTIKRPTTLIRIEENLH